MSLILFTLILFVMLIACWLALPDSPRELLHAEAEPAAPGQVVMG